MLLFLLLEIIFNSFLLRYFLNQVKKKQRKKLKIDFEPKQKRVTLTTKWNKVNYFNYNQNVQIIQCSLIDIKYCSVIHFFILVKFRCAPTQMCRAKESYKRQLPFNVVSSNEKYMKFEWKRVTFLCIYKYILVALYWKAQRISALNFDLFDPRLREEGERKKQRHKINIEQRFVLKKNWIIIIGFPKIMPYFTQMNV